MNEQAKETKQETRHTPGPWVFSTFTKSHGAGVSNRGYFVQEKQGEHICDLPVDSNNGPKQHANVRLIAAAPELLEALERAQIYIESVADRSFGKGENNYADYELLEEVENAIEKARGRAGVAFDLIPKGGLNHDGRNESERG